MDNISFMYVDFKTAMGGYVTNGAWLKTEKCRLHSDFASRAPGVRLVENWISV